MVIDLTSDATVRTAALPWDPSPAPGVLRRRIERNGDEVARLTSIVRYAAGSSFPPHTHGGGEEYLVLSGTFSDERGDHGPGTYVRNGVGSRHTPFTRDGCEILVRLWWMHPEETVSSVRLPPFEWSPQPWGESTDLHHSAFETVRLLRVTTGHCVQLATSGGLEVFVLSGGLVDHPVGTWMRRVQAASETVTASEDTTLWVRSGHLQCPPALPDP